MPSKIRHTKIVATLGPASSSAKVLTQMIKAGMNVARINMSHGSQEIHAATIHQVRSIADELGKYVAILLDLSGPKIRVGSIRGEAPLCLVRGKKIKITTGKVEGTTEVIPTTYAKLVDDVRKGSSILLDDGKIELEVIGKKDKEVECRILVGGLLYPNKGMNLPGTKFSIPALTKKDRVDINFALEERVDYIALSFVRQKSDISELRKILKKNGSKIPIIAKIEKPEAIEHLDDILKETDAVMVARGDLAVEVSFERVPVLQKLIIQRANQRGVPVITATQMLESMTQQALPTRAEATDVANAVFDGTDAVMLSAETATGKYPIKSIQSMDKLAKVAEEYYVTQASKNYVELSDPIDSVIVAAYRAAAAIKAKAILVFSLSGRTARLLSKLKPRQPIFALSPKESVCRRMALFWSVTPFSSHIGNNSDEMIQWGAQRLRKVGYLKKNDLVVILCGSSLVEGEQSHTMKVMRV